MAEAYWQSIKLPSDITAQRAKGRFEGDIWKKYGISCKVRVASHFWSAGITEEHKILPRRRNRILQRPRSNKPRASVNGYKQDLRHVGYPVAFGYKARKSDFGEM